MIQISCFSIRKIVSYDMNFKFSTEKCSKISFNIIISIIYFF